MMDDAAATGPESVEALSGAHEDRLYITFAWTDIPSGIHAVDSISPNLSHPSFSTTRSNGMARSLRPLMSCATAVAALLLAPASTAWAQDAQTQQRALHTQALAATCANCHGTFGRANPGASVVGLAGLPAAYIVEQMKAFKSGTRPATVMHQLAKGYSDAQIEQMAAYFAALPR
jgi:cytochrome subunit of sulfide dehydrogenase